MSRATLEVVLATHNAHKVQEFQHILGEHVPGITVLPYDGPEPVEDGTSFDENAFIKARAAASHTGRIALAAGAPDAARIAFEGAVKNQPGSDAAKAAQAELDRLTQPAQR